MLETLIVVLLILWLVGAFGGAVFPVINLGSNHSLVHVLLVVVLILVIFRFARSG